MGVNKQPFYHACYLSGKKEDILKALSGIRTVLKDSIEYNNNELLFTATSDVSSIVNKKLSRIAEIETECNAEPGDPSDLL
jgi:hypothetical protein